MSKTLASLIFWMAPHVAIAQLAGQVDFANLAPGVNAPVSDASGNRIGSPSPYVADLFWSANTNASMDSLTPVGHITPFITVTNYGRGYFFGGTVDVNLPYYYIVAQVRVWDTNYGSYYETRDKGAEFGFSNLIIVLPDFPPGTPTPLVGLQSFQLQRLPHLIITPTTTNILLLSWPVEVTSYAVQQNSDISLNNWVTLTNAPVVIGWTNQVTLTKPQGTVFYRLVSQ